MRILVVEDELRLARALHKGLTTSGFAVTLAADGPTGYQLARDEVFDALVLDVMLPGMNGFAVCEQLRRDGVRTPILVLTARDDALDEAEALDLGADDFLRKPFSYLVLVARLNALLRRGMTGRPAVLRALETADPDDPRLVADLLAETVRLQQLTEQLLVLARLDRGGADLHPVTVDLDDAADRAIDRAPRRDGMVVDASGVLPVQVSGEAALLERVVGNLVENAVRHARSRVVVRTAGLAAGAELTVEDDGPGVPEDDRERVLDGFVRLDEARARDSGGVGLGLTVVRDTVLAHGGSVTVGASPLGGARVRVVLPAGDPLGTLSPAAPPSRGSRALRAPPRPSR